MKKIQLNKKGYSTLIVLLLVGFIIVLATGIFRLVINEMKSNKVMGDYLKAYAGAESAQELALLEIKKKGYGYNGMIESNINSKSIMLSENPLNRADFNINRDVLISYYNDGKVNSYEGEIQRLGYDIIPLFYIDDVGNSGLTVEKKVTRVELKVTGGFADDLSWNIIGNKSGISGIGAFDYQKNGSEKLLQGGQFAYKNTSIGDFLSNSTTNYLVLFNSGNNKVSYTISAPLDSFFTKPRLDITSSGEVGEYRQNLKTRVDNTEFLSILKYSIYSGN